MRPRLYWPVTLAAAALIGLLAYGVAGTGADTTLDDAIRDGRRVEPPQARLQVLGGDATRSLADYKGKVVLVNVWASWCEPCRDELPLLERTHKRIAPEGGMVLGIDVKENTGAALAAAREFGLSYPNLRDPDGSYVRDFGQTGYPETYVLDRDGRVAAVRRFPVTQAWLDRTIPPLLEEKA
jgi:cytochrome c biogenesis protein CcmG, thiol:disulfide interchange protein DsbE